MRQNLSQIRNAPADPDRQRNDADLASIEAGLNFALTELTDLFNDVELGPPWLWFRQGEGKMDLWN
jgi:hypothetical protein